MPARSHLLVLLAISLTVAATNTLAATPSTVASQTITGLGTLSFATSTQSPEAQTAFIRGLLLLHLFEYSQAADAFISAEKLDPGYAMAYWGEAMTFNHGVWNQLDTASGKAALAKFAPTADDRAARARKPGIADPRERSYLAAVELLYDGTGTKPDRDARYAKAMEQLAAANPKDADAQLFYALALISQSESVRDVPVYLHAAEISKAIFRLQPNNPGAAHYWIHGMDDPQHAAGALEAARALSKIAPDAPHAQHMCSHIFIALGMWDEVVQSNLDAVRVGAAIDVANGFPPYNCGHYPYWLTYAYFQQGRARAAFDTIEACARTGAAAPKWAQAHPDQHPYGSKNTARLQARLASALAEMRATAVIEDGDWHNASLKIVGDTPAPAPEDMAGSSFVAGYAAAELGDLGEARKQLESLGALMDKIKAGSNPDPEDLKTIAVQIDELSGLVHAKQGDYPAATTDLTRAAEAYKAMAFAFGPPVTIKPPHELLGELLLAHGDATAACTAFQESLQLAPRRSLSLLGLARARKASGDTAAAAATYKELASIWHSADPDTTSLSEVRTAATH